MQVCDRTWNRDGQPVAATVQVQIESATVLEVYHLCEEELEALRIFLNDPGAWRLKPGPKPGSSRKVTRLEDAARA